MKLPIVLCSIALVGCVQTVTLSDGERRCEYQKRTAIDAESVETVRTLVVDAAGRMLEQAPAPKAKQQAPACTGALCLRLDSDGCYAQVGQ
jgi:hypothetical protein